MFSEILKNKHIHIILFVLKKCQVNSTINKQNQIMSLDSIKAVSTLFLFFSLSNFVYSQKIISGLITDSETNEALPFTNILYPEDGQGTVSNAEGNYIINLDKFQKTDSITFSYGGYKPVSFCIQDIDNKTSLNVSLAPLIISLEEIVITDKEISVKEIIKNVAKNYERNYKKDSLKEEVFIHNFQKTSMNKDNPLTLKKSSFEEINAIKSQAIIDQLPNEFINYVDGRHSIYTSDGNSKLVTHKAISLEESSLEKINKELENTFKFLAEDIENTYKEKDVYYKFKTGIIGGKIDDDNNENEDSVNVETAKVIDSLSYNIKTKYVKSSINGIFNNVTDVDSDFLEFITKTGKYNYELEGATMINEEVAYKVLFTPKSGGKFTGLMYISSDTYAILQMNIEYAPGKRGKHIQLLGFGFSENYKKAKVIFEKQEEIYLVKYIYLQENISFSVERNFSLLKKKKRFMFDKTLEEIKIKTNLHMSSNETKELLVLEREKITPDEFEKIKEKDTVKVKREVTNSIDLWEGGTMIAPTKALKEYHRKKEF